MKFLTRRESEEGAAEPGAAIKLGAKPAAAEAQMQWGLILVIFMRVLAALWIFQGLAEWALVLVPEKSVLEALPAAMAAAVIFFAIADLVAAVGLWLATPWAARCGCSRRVRKSLSPSRSGIRSRWYGW